MFRPALPCLAFLATAGLFWSIGNGVPATRAMRLDALYRELDARFEETSPQPTQTTKTGGPGSLMTWASPGRRGRQMVAAGPDRDKIEPGAARRRRNCCASMSD